MLPSGDCCCCGTALFVSLSLCPGIANRYFVSLLVSPSSVSFSKSGTNDISFSLALLFAVISTLSISIDELSPSGLYSSRSLRLIYLLLGEITLVAALDLSSAMISSLSSFEGRTGTISEQLIMIIASIILLPPPEIFLITSFAELPVTALPSTMLMELKAL